MATEEPQRRFLTSATVVELLAICLGTLKEQVGADFTDLQNVITNDEGNKFLIIGNLNNTPQVHKEASESRQPSRMETIINVPRICH